MSRPRVLIIDDEPSNLGLLRQTPQEEYNLFFAKGGGGLAAGASRTGTLSCWTCACPTWMVTKRAAGSRPIRLTPGSGALYHRERQRADSESQGSRRAEWIISTSRSVRARCVPGCNHLSLVRLDQLECSYRTAIVMLSEAGRYNDTDTGVHIWRMAAYARPG